MLSYCQSNYRRSCWTSSRSSPPHSGEDLAVAAESSRALGGGDPLGLVGDDVVAASGLAGVGDPTFDADAFLLAIHGDASFAALRHGRANLGRLLGAHDHKMQLLVRDNLHSFLATADKAHRLTVAFDRLLQKQPPRGADDDGGAPPPPSSSAAGAASKLDVRRLAELADTAVGARFDPVLQLIDRATALQTTTNLLVLFAPLTDVEYKASEDAQRRWADALRNAARWDAASKS